MEIKDNSIVEFTKNFLKEWNRLEHDCGYIPYDNWITNPKILKFKKEHDKRNLKNSILISAVDKHGTDVELKGISRYTYYVPENVIKLKSDQRTGRKSRKGKEK